MDEQNAEEKQNPQPEQVESPPVQPEQVDTPPLDTEEPLISEPQQEAVVTETPVSEPAPQIENPYDAIPPQEVSDEKRDEPVQTMTSPRPSPKFPKDQSRLQNENPIQIAWFNLEYKVNLTRPIVKLASALKIPPCGKRCKPIIKHILKPQVGFVNPGQVLAIMGPSGSGKTSLLNILALRVDLTGGGIYINGAPATKKFKTVSAYVQQDDILNGNLTVYEALFFTALLRLPPSLSYADKKERVLDTIDELGLRHCMGTKIGVPGLSKGISGGERKRVSIGVELLTSPSVLFLDEPTSGLDSKTALSIMHTINRLAKDQNRSVICTIHQPRSDIFSFFDKLLLLTDGSPAYFGDAQAAVPYFENMGFKMPDEYNPADFLIDLITKTANDTAEFKGRKRIEQERIETLVDTFKKTPLRVPKVDSSFILEKRNIPKYSQWAIVEFCILFIRFSLNNMRDKMFTFVRSGQAVFMGLLIGFIYLQVKSNQKSIQDRIGALFFVLVNQAQGSLFSALVLFQSEKTVFIRERGSKTYRVGSYYLAKILSDIPMQILLAVVLSTIVYWMVGFKRDAGAFFTFLLVIILVTMTGQGLGLLISCLIPNMAVGFAVAPVLGTILMIFGGFYLNASSIGPWFIWIHYLSFYKYGFECLLINEFTGAEMMCFEDEYISAGGFKLCPITTGAQVIKSYGVENANIWINVAVLIALSIGLRLLAYLAVRFNQKSKVGK